MHTCMHVRSPAVPVQSSEGGDGYMLEVHDDGTAMFLGDFLGSDVDNIRSMFYNSGTME